jgi:hypothetical protein
MPQDRLPPVRRYCDDRCARKAWLVARAQRSITSVGALEVAIRRLRKSRYPRLVAAASALVELRRQLVDEQAPARLEHARTLFREVRPELTEASS